MTIVMDDDNFSSSLTSSSSSSSTSTSSNYNTLTSNDSTTTTTTTSTTNITTNNNNNTIINNDSNQEIDNNSQSTTTTEMGGPYAIFIFRSSSGTENANGNSGGMPEERRISLETACKIGRSVAKIKPEKNNAIFDCKVLSRNHALLWQEIDNEQPIPQRKFYIRDTKSSNGTFLNGTRLGKSNEDSEPFEITSGDIIQFGVDVTEANKKVTHGCITVECKLYHQMGQEAVKMNQQTNRIDVQTQELYQLALVLQEAVSREQVLQQKLNVLTSFIEQARETSENSWITLISEDRLLSRIDSLEKQLILNKKPIINESSFHKTIENLKNEKFDVETLAKEQLQQMIEEKNEIAQSYDEIKASLATKEEQLIQMTQLNENAKSNLLSLADKYQQLVTESNQLQDTLNETKDKLKLMEEEKEKIECCQIDLINNEKKLQTQVESLIAESDFKDHRIQGMLKKIEQQQQQQQKEKEKLVGIDDKDDTTNNIQLNSDRSEEIQRLRSQLQQEINKNLKLKEENIELLSKQVQSINEEKQNNEIPSLDQKLDNTNLEHHLDLKKKEISHLQYDLETKNKFISMLLTSSPSKTKTISSHFQSFINKIENDNENDEEIIKNHSKTTSNNNNNNQSDEESNKEWIQLQLDCIQLRKQINKIENEMKLFLK
jgi:pSer/pThr/pTyr-binding forkhead associated (FHA) protein